MATVGFPLRTVVAILLLVLLLPAGQSLTVPGGPKLKALLADDEALLQRKAFGALDLVQSTAGQDDCVRKGLSLQSEALCSTGVASPIVQVLGVSPCLLEADGDVWCTTTDTEDSDGRWDFLGGGAVQIAVVGDEAWAALDDGDVHYWSKDDNPGYDLGVADAVAVGWMRSTLGLCILKDTGAVDCGGTAADRPAGTVRALAQGNGGASSCFALTSGGVACPDAPALDLAGVSAVAASADDHHLCAVTTAGNVRCSGPAGATWADYNGRDAVAVEVLDAARCILRENGNVLCRGSVQGHALPSYAEGDAIAIELDTWPGYCVVRAPGDASCYDAEVGSWFGQAAPLTGGWV